MSTSSSEPKRRYDAVAHLGRLRRDVPALASGGLWWVYAQGDVLVYVREHTSASVLVMASRSGFESVSLPSDLLGGLPRRRARDWAVAVAGGSVPSA
ncbi:hypothetical protein P4U43_03380 [Arthrobacter sp. EH-1B-1]|uniref:Uncharacterized protein n=1 Tax=Arthrobacter vasquezii TaxID=2977629 RepID=A0ABT6CRZ6_9MICC|nr:hypothetical protein [Arthrobacter vasquezii]MDF9276828.1 hypothetical protein [Arthrobacter vasquezii]